MFFPNRNEPFDILNELRILRISFLIIRKIESEAIVGKKMHLNLFNLNNLYDVIDSLMAYWFKYLTTCVNIKLNKDAFPHILLDEPNKYPSLTDKESDGDSVNLEENEKKLSKSDLNKVMKKKSFFTEYLQRKKTTFKNSKNDEESPQNIMMYTFKSKGNIYKSHMLQLKENGKKKFIVPEYKMVTRELEKTININCKIFVLLYWLKNCFRSIFDR